MDGPTLRIEIDDATRDNPLLDEAMGRGSPAAAAPAPAPAPPKGGPDFPATVLGPDGKAYSLDAFHTAQRKIEGQRRTAEANAAFEAFHPAPPLPPMSGRWHDSADVDTSSKANETAPAGPQAEPSFLANLARQLGLGRYTQALGPLGGGEAAGAAEAGGLAAAAGPAAAALVAVELQTKSMQALKAATDAVAQGMQGLAQNDLTGFREGMFETEKSLLNAIPLVGAALAAQADAAHAIVTLPEKVKDAFLQRAGELAQFSGPISGAEARAEARGIMADVREANELGPDLARLVDAETDLKMELRQLILPIKQVVVENLADGMEAVLAGARVAANLPSILGEFFDTLAKVIVFTAKGDQAERDKSLDLFKKWLELLLKKKPDDGPEDLWAPFFGALNRARR